MKTMYGTVTSISSKTAVSQISVNNACRIKVVYQGASSLYLYAPGVNVISGTAFGSNTTTANPKQIDAVLTSAGKWNVVVKHGITTATTLASTPITISTYSDNQCLNSCSGKANSLGL